MWLHEAMNKLNGEAVEKEVAASIRTMHKTGRAFAQRGMQTYAGNCDTIKAEIEQFQKTVPLLVVSYTFPGAVTASHWLHLCRCSLPMIAACSLLTNQKWCYVPCIQRLEGSFILSKIL